MRSFSLLNHRLKEIRNYQTAYGHSFAIVKCPQGDKYCIFSIQQKLNNKMDCWSERDGTLHPLLMFWQVKNGSLEAKTFGFRHRISEIEWHINVLYFDFDLRDIETIRQASFILMKHVTHLDGIWSSQDCVLRPFKETPSLQPYTPMIAEIMSLWHISHFPWIKTS